jgi:aspartate racemase
MKTIGLIGGLSWESSAEYYKLINQSVQQELGGVHSAKIVMHSFDFQDIKNLQHEGKWQELTERMIGVAKKLQSAGADILVICSNTMHKMADDIAQAITIPLLHIADPTGEAIKAANIKTVGLLGTAFTMEQEFYRGRLQKKFGLKVITPGDTGRATIHAAIYNELVKGIITDTSRDNFKSIIRDLAGQGAQAVILGCTEIMLLVKEADSPVPLFDTTSLHARQAVKMALTMC